MRVGFTNGAIFTGVANHGLVSHITVTDGVVTSVGSLEPNLDQTIDLLGGFLMPAFGDGHAHPLFGGYESMGPQIKGSPNLQAVLDEVGRFAAANKHLEWIVGASYESWHAEGGDFDARWLDAVVPDRPVVLRSNDYHTVWCNTVALEAAGITADTPDPELGWIVRRPDGSPMGTLREWDAVDMVLDKAPQNSLETMIRGIEIGSAELAKHGITWVQDAWVEPGMPEAYEEALRQGRLPLRYNLALRADPRNWREQLEWFAATRARVGSTGQLTANTIKIFADGVIEGHTAALHEAYADHAHEHGMPVWQWSEMRDCVIAIDALGFQPHIHAIGDEGLHQALNAIEAAQKANGAASHARPVITHVQLLDPADLPRFSKLGVIANFEGLWACNDQLQRELTAPRVGSVREMWQYPMASLINSGATLSMGSDWPVSDQNPLKAMGVAVTRKEPGVANSAAWIPAERLSVQEALSAYTRGSALQAGQENVWGQIKVGLSADLVWLEASPFEVEPENLGAIRVLATWLQGKQIYRSN